MNLNDSHIMSTPVGFWGNQTSTITFCETKYEVTIYVAEFWNTLSNLVYIVPSIFAAIRYSKYKPVDWKFVSLFIMLIFMGMGSWMFHMTMKYYMQLWDELSMVVVQSQITYTSLVIIYGDDGAKKFKLPVFFYYGSGVFVYLVLKFPTIFHIMFAFNSYAVFGASYLAGKHVKSQLTGESKFIAHIDTKMLIWGSIYAQLAFFPWIIDLKLCPHVQWVRELLWSPLRPVTQLHLWWHMISGYAAYILIVHTCQARIVSLKKKMMMTFDFFDVMVHDLSDIS